VLNGVKFDQMSPEERGGTYRYHGVVLIRISRNEITYWREYQHISPLAWEEFVGVTKF